MYRIERNDEVFEIDERLPLLPLRDVVVFPFMTIPLFVGRPPSVSAIEEAVSRDRLLFATAQRRPDIAEPAREDLYRIGTVVRVLQLFRLPDGTMRVLVEGIARMQARRIYSGGDFATALLSPMEDRDPGLPGDGSADAERPLPVQRLRPAQPARLRRRAHDGEQPERAVEPLVHRGGAPRAQGEPEAGVPRGAGRARAAEAPAGRRSPASWRSSSSSGRSKDRSAARSRRTRRSSISTSSSRRSARNWATRTSSPRRWRSSKRPSRRRGCRSRSTRRR